MEVDRMQEELRRKIEDLPALNAVVLEILRRSGHPDCSIREIAEVIATDAFLTARVLRLANSSYYGLPQRVEAVSVAVPLLGIRNIRKLVLGISTYDIMSQDLAGYGQVEGALWAHSLAVSVATEHLCEMLGYRKAEELRLSALLHDIGKIILSSLLMELLDDDARHALCEGKISAVQLEREVCDIDHTETGAMIAEKWNLSPRFIEVIRYHHNPIEAPNMPKACSIVCLADCMATWLLKADNPALAIKNIKEEALQPLQLSMGDIVPEMVDINRKVGEEIGFWMGYKEKPLAAAEAG